MEYIFNSDSISNLIYVTEDIYFKYKEILDVNYKDDKYYYLIGELTRLSKKEDEILLSLPKTSRLLDDVNCSIKKVYKCDDYFMYNFVLNRIDSNICNLCALAEDNEFADLANVSLIDSQKNINFITDELYYNFILRLNNVINNISNLNDKRKVRFIQLAHIFSFKNISDAFINNNLCLECDLISQRENFYKDIDLFNSFMYLKNYISFNLCESVLMRNITLSNYYNDQIANVFNISNLLLFKSLLQDINDSDFIEIKNSFMYDFDNYDSNNYIINKLKIIFDLEYDRRFFLENNESVQSLDEKNSSNLITLLKVEEVLYDKIMGLKFDESDNYTVISSLIDYEQDVISELDIDKDNASVFFSVINRDLGFFIDVNDNLFKKNSIIQRLRNNLEYFRKIDMADGILEKNYFPIISNHIVDSLKNYNGDLSIMKSYLYMYPNLTRDLVLMDGNYSLIDRFSDEITSISIGNSNIYDYLYDKDKQLYNYFSYILDDLTRYSDFYETDWNNLFDFKLCELSDIIDNVSDEHLCKIKEEVFCLDDGIIKKKILSLFKNKVH